MYFNNVDLSDYLKIKTINGRGLSPSELNLINIPGMDGAYLQDKKTPVRVLEIEANIIADNKEELRIKIDELNGILSVDEPVPITFSDEPSMTYYGITESTGQNNEFFFMHDGTLTIMCIDPYKYGPEKEKELDFKTTVNNEGSAEAFPTFELEVLEPITFAMVQNQENEYMMIGQPADVDEQVVDTRTLLFEENGSTLGQWSTSPTEVDGGVSTGALSTDGAGITVPSANYGSGNRWHGPSMIREIDSTQDFEIDMRLQAQTNTPSTTYRIEFYLYDEGMNVLGKMAVLDSSQNMQRVTGEGRVGPYISRFENYVISSRNYQYNWDYFFGMCRLRRVGNKFEFYLSRVGNNDQYHVFSLKETFRDANNEFMGKLKYVQIHIGKYGDSSSAFGPKIFSIKGYALEQANVDQTPYIATTGDTIVFDSQNEEMLLNGEGATRLKDFGATYFTLKKGVNELIIHPTESFNAMLRYRERSK